MLHKNLQDVDGLFSVYDNFLIPTFCKPSILVAVSFLVTLTVRRTAYLLHPVFRAPGRRMAFSRVS